MLLVKHSIMTLVAVLGAVAGFVLAPAPWFGVAAGVGFVGGAALADFFTLELEEDEDG
jgi:hypothetical protein